MADIQREIVNGINTIIMHNKHYVEVRERLRLVYDQKREFEVLESAPFLVGDRCLWRMVIKVDGKLYTGNAEVKLKNAISQPDKTNPFECGETSALGRALAFAGFGSVESIASFDEVYRATNSNAPVQRPQAQQPTQSKGGSTAQNAVSGAFQGQEAPTNELNRIYAIGLKAGKYADKKGFSVWVQKTLKLQQAIDVRTLKPSELSQVAAAIGVDAGGCQL